MALSVTSNFAISAGYASNNMRGSQSLMGKSINRISSGHRAANPADDIASYISGTKLKADSKGYAILSTGVQDAAAKLNMVDAAFADVENGLLELKAQAIAYNALATTDSGRNALSSAFTQTLAGINAMSAAMYKEDSLYATTLNAYFGWSTGTSAALNVGGTSLSFSSLSLNIGSVSGIQSAINSFASKRATIGGNISALEQISSYLSDMATSADAAYTAVTEVDMAREMTSYVKNNIQSQAAQAMVAQANQGLAQVINLLQV